jgi:hypothetical protein
VHGGAILNDGHPALRLRITPAIRGVERGTLCLRIRPIAEQRDEPRVSVPFVQPQQSAHEPEPEPELPAMVTKNNVGQHAAATSTAGGYSTASPRPFRAKTSGVAERWQMAASKVQMEAVASVMTERRCAHNRPLQAVT